MDATTPPTPLEVPEPATRGDWDGWGSTRTALPAAARTIAATLLSGTPHPVPRRTAPPALTPSRLNAAVPQLAAIVGEDAVTCADTVRLMHLGGKSTPDLLARRLQAEQLAPDAVCAPASHEQIAAILDWCGREDVAIVPFGGGTSVVGGVEPEAGAHRAVLALDLSRTAALLHVDEVSLLATFGAGTTGPQAEAMLGARGFTLGHFPQSFEYATIGGYAATRSSGQASRGYGRFDDLVHGLRVATPIGELQLGRAPASAAGPDLREVFLGSEGAFGILTEVTVRIRPRPAVTAYGAWRFRDFAQATAAIRDATQRGIRPTVLRVSDATETRVNAAMGGHLLRMRGCLAVATVDAASAEEGTRTVDDLDQVLRYHGATTLGEEPARSWERGRFASPALRDSLLDIGVLAETLETATTWDRLAGLKTAVTAALREALDAHGTKPLVLCHISHVYPAGASLYFTIVAALTADPVQQWAHAKAAGSAAILTAGGTITHHHAVGRDHRPYLADEVGPVGVAVLQAIKSTVDPRGILNPGVLVPATPS